MKIPWERFGAKLGVGVALLGFILVFLGWNGAASSDRVPSQFPYLISGGITGLCLVIIGAALIVVESGREDRTRLRAEIEELRAAFERGGGGTGSGNGSKPAPERPSGRGPFVAGETTFHLPSCDLLEGRGHLPRVSREQVAERGLVACRVCGPESEFRKAEAAARKARSYRRLAD